MHDPITLATSTGTGIMGCAFVVVAVVGGLAVLAALLGGVQKCDVCETPLKRKAYRWKIDGKWERLCPKCNSRMERKQSSDKFKRRFG